jgi:hypothetical protein
VLGKLHIFRRGHDVRRFALKAALDLIDVVFAASMLKLKRDRYQNHHLKRDLMEGSRCRFGLACSRRCLKA